MAQSGSGFDMSKMSTANKILLGGGLLYLIDLFLPWNRACIDIGVLGGNICGSAAGTHGIGIINLLLAIALLIWEGLALAGVDIPVPRPQVTAAGGGGIVLFTIIKVLVDNQSLYLFAFVGIVLALVIAYGSWMRWQEASVGSPPPGGGGGFTS